MMHTLEIGVGGFSTGETAALAASCLFTAKFELNMAFDKLADKITKFPADEKETTILESAVLAQRFLAAVEWFEHVNALDVAYKQQQLKKQGAPTQ